MKTWIHVDIGYTESYLEVYKRRRDTYISASEASSEGSTDRHGFALSLDVEHPRFVPGDP